MQLAPLQPGASEQGGQHDACTVRDPNEREGNEQRACTVRDPNEREGNGQRDVECTRPDVMIAYEIE
jgi:hypothetical protein